VWWQPRRDGGRDAALLTPEQWCEAVASAGGRGDLPELPVPGWLLVAPSTGDSFAGVPGLSDAALRTAVSVDWVTPVLTGALVAVLALALVIAVASRLRAGRAEMQAVRMQSEFLTTVTHELKTPLAAIRLLGEMLADGRAQGRETEYYQMLAGEAGRLSMLIENVLDLGRLERGERAYDLRAVDVGEVVGETLAMFAPLAERDGGKVVWDDLCGRVIVRVDRGALVQALVAVLDNARKYGGAGARLDVVTRCHDGTVAIDVRDRGPGVPVAERERIFERFVRGEAHAHGGTPGVGIGLYLARSIARRLRGDLVCTDPLDGGAGACFTFTLPVETSA
jgi:two-component system phosphate regulon sensor histidine kinase PhoR